MPTENPRLSTTVTDQYMKALKDLVESGVFLNEGEAVRDALRVLFKSHGLDIMWGTEDSDEGSAEGVR